MKSLKCPECRSREVVPPTADRAAWLCGICLRDFKVTRKDAKKILKRADKKGTELNGYMPFLIRAAEKKQKRQRRQAT
jgi:hypothetical protein